MAEGRVLAAVMLATISGRRKAEYQPALDRLLQTLQDQEATPPFRVAVSVKSYGTFLVARSRPSAPVDDWGPPPAGAPCTCRGTWADGIPGPPGEDCPQHGEPPDGAR